MMRASKARADFLQDQLLGTSHKNTTRRKTPLPKTKHAGDMWRSLTIWRAANPTIDAVEERKTNSRPSKRNDPQATRRIVLIEERWAREVRNWQSRDCFLWPHLFQTVPPPERPLSRLIRIHAALAL